MSRCYLFNVEPFGNSDWKSQRFDLIKHDWCHRCQFHHLESSCCLIISRAHSSVLNQSVTGQQIITRILFICKRKEKKQPDNWVNSSKIWARFIGKKTLTIHKPIQTLNTRWLRPYDKVMLQNCVEKSEKRICGHHDIWSSWTTRNGRCF